MMWEYKIVALFIPSASSPNRDIKTPEFDLNLLGKESWELVSVVPRGNDPSDTTYGIFKRPRGGGSAL
jgi:hypothetical protein